MSKELRREQIRRRIVIDVTKEQRRLLDKHLHHGTQNRIIQALIDGLLQKLDTVERPHLITAALMHRIDIMDALLEGIANDNARNDERKSSSAAGRGSPKKDPRDSAEPEDVEETEGDGGDNGDPDTDFFGYAWPKNRL